VLSTTGTKPKRSGKMLFSATKKHLGNFKLTYSNNSKLYALINFILDRTSAAEYLFTGVMEPALITTTFRLKIEAEGNPSLSGRGFPQVELVTSSVSTEN
jgi:hypothetical protein